MKKLRFLCDIQTGERDTENAVENGEYPFFVRSQHVERINSATYDCEAVLTAGDGAGVGKVFHHFTGKFDFHQRVYMLNNFRGVSGRFIYYFLKEIFASVALDGGAKSTVDSLRRPMFLNFPVCVPSEDEQRTIVAFLDRETGKIDALIAEQERLIELLDEKRQAVIAHAVTKGLNPSVATKHSGTEWLGELPAHWGVERGRWLFEKRDLPPQPDDGVVTAFRDGEVTLRTNRRTDGFTLAVLEVGYQRVLSGDLVVHGMDAFAGAIGVSDSTGKCTPEYVVLKPKNAATSNQYFAHVLRLMALRNYIYVICPSVRERAPRFRFEAFKDVALPVPPTDEQHEIVRRISQTLQLLAQTATEAARCIELLNERRTALITAAVTGQIDVRPESTQSAGQAA